MLGLLAVISCVAWAGTGTTEPQAKPEKQRRGEAIKQAIAAKDFDKALTLLEKMGNDKDATPEEQFMSIYYQFDIQAKHKHDGAKACPLAKKISEMMGGCQITLNYLAWTILDTPNLQNRDLNLALELAKKAAEISKNEDCTILDTLARAYFEKGDLDKAIEVQAMAVEKCPLKKTLDKYKAKKAAQK
jgi:tetratricopeptide (TPR) repeat protein